MLLIQFHNFRESKSCTFSSNIPTAAHLIKKYVIKTQKKVAAISSPFQDKTAVSFNDVQIMLLDHKKLSNYCGKFNY